MSSEKMLYWVTLAAMTFFVGNHFATKHHRNWIADQTVAIVQHLGTEATHIAANAEAVLDGGPSFARSETEWARVQGHFASLEASMTRQQVACARLQAEHARMAALQQVQHLRIVCPRQSIKVQFPRISECISQSFFN